MKNKIQSRAKLLRDIREYFYQEGVLEVDTPIMTQFGNSDPALLNFTSLYHGPGKLYNARTYLITSPEYHMKRLLAHHSGSIYYLGKVFRDGELSHRHTPEFTMLEWYRVDYDLEHLIQEITLLIQRLSQSSLKICEYSYLDLFQTKLGVNPFLASIASLQDILERHHISLTFEPRTKDEYLDLIMSHIVELTFDPSVLTVLHSYPASQASLAKIVNDSSGHLIGKRFEIYWKGLELANGYEELTDPIEQRARFEAENVLRQEYDLEVVEIDELLLRDMAKMPALVSGVALGVDRLLQAMQGAETINDVILFAFDES